MPIFSYFVIAGSVLVGLLFAADAVMPSREPLTIGSEFHGLPETAHSAQPENGTQILRHIPAPEPDMNSAVVVASQPRHLIPASGSQSASDGSAQGARSDAMAKAAAEAAPESKPAAKPKTANKSPKQHKRVVRQHRRNDHGPNFAWTWHEERRPWGWNDRQYYRGRF